MSQCPVCQTNFVQSECCQTCGWDLLPLPFWVGLVPEVVQKEAARLEWAKQIWKTAKLNLQEQHPLQQQLQEQFQDSSNREQHHQTELRQVNQDDINQDDINQDDVNLAGALPERETRVASLQNQPLEVMPPRPLPIAPLAPPNWSKAIAVELEMLLIPGGTFWMGSPDTEAERDINESPQHQVTISEFYLGKFPVTQTQWRDVAILPKIHRSLSMHPSDFEGDDRPVEQVSWYDAIEFCDRLSYYTGDLYRLPSEAEWEYACRAGTTTPFCYGNTLTADLANYDGNYTYNDGKPGIYRHGTTPIGTFQTLNAFGLSDLHGNVWEWCADSWHENYQGAPRDRQAWEDPEGGTYRMLRGGAWYCLPGLCRSAQRHWNQPDIGGSGIGLRVVRSLSTEIKLIDHS
ncbi:MAG: formylglycine-generating enzyme family protein [Phormidesmis sp. CAN_BIN36]|nr:formylglycine-generating enzyme family protein [Phormidesmis sp. CAN_BIN36]